MIIKKLTPGQRFLASGVHELYAEFSVSTNNDVGFEFSVPNVDSRRRGDHIAVQGLTDSTEVTLLPMAQAFPSQTIAFVSLTLVGADHDSDVQLDFPAFDVSNLATFTLGTLSMTPVGLAIDVADLVEDVGLDPAASEIRSVARSTLAADTAPEMRKRDATIIVDVSASMGRSLQQDQFQAMCQFASGVLAVAAAGRTIRLCTSGTDSRPMVLASTDVEEIARRQLQFHEAGWNLDLSSISPDEALVVISDDIPAAIQGRPHVHVLTSRQPLVTGCTYTVFTPDFVQAVRESRSNALARDTEIMLNTLTGGQ